jgi:hypothetical protein
MSYMDYLERITQDDIGELREKDKLYGGSWLKRGGVGAYMNVARKIDRLEKTAEAHGWDVIEAASVESFSYGEGSVLDQIGDLRRYLMLVEAECRRLAAAASERVAETHGDTRRKVEDLLPPLTTSEGYFLPVTPEVEEEIRRQLDKNQTHAIMYGQPGETMARSMPLPPLVAGAEQYDDFSAEDQVKYAPFSLDMNVYILDPRYAGHRKILYPKNEVNTYEYNSLPDLHKVLYLWVESEVKWRLREVVRIYIER